MRRPDEYNKLRPIGQLQTGRGNQGQGNQGRGRGNLRIVHNPYDDELSGGGGGSAPPPPPVASPTIWFRSDFYLFQDTAGTTAASANNDPVGRWGDLSGNGRNLLQATAGKRPLLQTAQKNGQNGIRFDRVDDFLQCVDFTWAQPVHLFFACRQYNNNASGGRVMAAGGATGGIVQFYCNAVSGRYSAYAGATMNNDDLSATPTAYAIVEALYSGASSRLKINNGTPVTSNIGTNAFGGFTLGAYSDGSTPAYLDVLEVLGYSSALSTGDATIIRDYLNSRYAIF